MISIAYQNNLYRPIKIELSSSEGNF